MQTHDLKTWPDAFSAVWEGSKTHEFRRDDRDPPFAIGDLLELVYFDPLKGTPRRNPPIISAAVTHVSRGPDHKIPDGFCVMSIRVVRRRGNKP